MTTLAEMTLLVSRLLQTTVEGIATDGSTTTLIDATLTQGANVFDDGTIWFTSGDNDGITRPITAWDATTWKFTFATLDDAIASGVYFSAAVNEYPRWALVQAVNRALEKIGGVIAFDTTLTTVANQESYTLPAGVRRILEVEIAGSTSAPYRYKTHHYVTERGGKIYFEDYTEPGSAGYTIRLRYLDAHDLLEADTDTIDAEIHDNVVKYCAAVEAMRWKKQRRGGDIDEDKLGMLMNDYKQALFEHRPPARRDPRAPVMGLWGSI